MEDEAMMEKETMMEKEKTEQVRIRIAYKVNAKGTFQPDITSEAETVETAMENLRSTLEKIKVFAANEGTFEE